MELFSEWKNETEMLFLFHVLYNFTNIWNFFALDIKYKYFQGQSFAFVLNLVRTFRIPFEFRIFYKERKIKYFFEKSISLGID